MRGKASVVGVAMWALASVGWASASAAAPGDIDGVWLRANGASKIRIEACGGARCGTVVWEKVPRKDVHNPDQARRDDPIVGLRVLSGMKPTGEANQWKGSVYNAEDGRTYTGFATLQANGSLKLQGCVLGGLICKSDTWSKTH